MAGGEGESERQDEQVSLGSLVWHYRPGWQPQALRSAHLADAPGTRRVIQGEHLTIHYLSPFEVTVCRVRGDRMMRSRSPGRLGNGWLFPLTVAHRTALAIWVEGVGTGDGTVHR